MTKCDSIKSSPVCRQHQRKTKMRAPQYFVALLLALAFTSVLTIDDNNKKTVANVFAAHAVIRVSRKSSKPLISPTKNPLGFAFGTIYSCLVKGYISLAQTSKSVYNDHILTRLENTKEEATQKAAELIKAVKEQSDSLKKSVTAKKEIVEKKFTGLLELLENSSAAAQEALYADLEYLSDIVVRMQDPDFLLATDESDVELVVESIVNKLISCINEENPIPKEEQEEDKKEISFVDSAKSIIASAFNEVLYVILRVMHFITANVNIVTLFTGIVCAAALYLSIKLGLAFLRVVLWIVKLPIRIFVGIFHYIFGYSSEVDCDVDEEALVDECKVEEPVAKKSSSVRRLDGFDGISTDNILEADLVEDSVAEDDLEYLEADEADVEVLAASDKEPSPKPSTPTSSPSSAAVASTLAVLVATVALLI